MITQTKTMRGRISKSLRGTITSQLDIGVRNQQSSLVRIRRIVAVEMCGHKFCLDAEVTQRSIPLVALRDRHTQIPRVAQDKRRSFDRCHLRVGVALARQADTCLLSLLFSSIVFSHTWDIGDCCIQTSRPSGVQGDVRLSVVCGTLAYIGCPLRAIA